MHDCSVENTFCVYKLSFPAFPTWKIHYCVLAWRICRKAIMRVVDEKQEIFLLMPYGGNACIAATLLEECRDGSKELGAEMRAKTS
jgi:hypothetical protein